MGWGSSRYSFQKRKAFYLKTGYALIKDRPETKLLRTVKGAGVSNTLALVSEVGDVHRFAIGEHMASFLGLTSSKHISGTTLFQLTRITKQGSPNGRYAAVNVAQHLTQLVPRYQNTYQRIKDRKPQRKGHFIALVAVARDFVSNFLYDMWRNNRPFFVEVSDLSLLPSEAYWLERMMLVPDPNRWAVGKLLVSQAR